MTFDINERAYNKPINEAMLERPIWAVITTDKVILATGMTHHDAITVLQDTCSRGDGITFDGMVVTDETAARIVFEKYSS